jgi:hypothetical protein
MARGVTDISGKGAAVLAAALGLVVCLFVAGILIAVLIGPSGFQSSRTVLNLLVAAGVMPQSALAVSAVQQRALNEGVRAGSQQRLGRQGAAGAAARDADRPAVPGWDPVLRASSQDLAGLDPDEAVDRALGRGLPRTGEVPVPVLSGGRLVMVSPTAPGPAIVVPPGPPATAVGAATAAGAVPAAGAATAAAPAELVRQVLPPPPGARPPLPTIAVEIAFFLDPQQAESYAALLQGQGIPVRLVGRLDDAGRSWTYIRSPAFTDSVVALAYAAQLERKLGIVATLVTEPAQPREGS